MPASGPRPPSGRGRQKEGRWRRCPAPSRRGEDRLQLGKTAARNATGRRGGAPAARTRAARTRAARTRAARTPLPPGSPPRRAANRSLAAIDFPVRRRASPSPIRARHPPLCPKSQYAAPGGPELCCSEPRCPPPCSTHRSASGTRAIVLSYSPRAGSGADCYLECFKLVSLKLWQTFFPKRFLFPFPFPFPLLHFCYYFFSLSERKRAYPAQPLSAAPSRPAQPSRLHQTPAVVRPRSRAAPKALAAGSPAPAASRSPAGGARPRRAERSGALPARLLRDRERLRGCGSLSHPRPGQ